jgi:hypothetical protein
VSEPDGEPPAVQQQPQSKKLVRFQFPPGATAEEIAAGILRLIERHGGLPPGSQEMTQDGTQDPG